MSEDKQQIENEAQKAETTARNSGIVDDGVGCPWVGKLHHAMMICDDWGCIRDEDGECIMRVMIPDHDETVLNKHRIAKTDPTQGRVDAILNQINAKNGRSNSDDSTVTIKEDQLLQLHNANSPFIGVAEFLMNEFDCGWSAAETMVIRVVSIMKCEGWTITPPNR